MRQLKYFIIGILSLSILVSCNNTGKNDRSEANEESQVSNNCYLFVSGQDSIKMNISLDGKRVTGSLDYLFYEKDRSKGTIKGEMQGDRLNAVYTFNSEGTESTRQVIFKKVGNDFAEGYFVDGNYTIANFPATVVLVQVSCK